jgi:hypothetical protein
MKPSMSRLLVLAVLVVSVMMCASGPAGATPAYGRRYSVSCSTCHAPLPPRLNNFGMVFRRLGFRAPDSDESGKLVIKNVPAQGIGDAFSLSANADFQHSDQAEDGANNSTLELGEIELVAGTAIGNHVSVQTMFLPYNAEGDVELEDAELQYNAGTPGQQFVARAGLMQTFFWQKANHGALTLSMPLIFDEMAVQGVGNFGGFALGTKLIGVEAGYLATGLKDGRLSATQASVALYNGVNTQGEHAIHNTTSGTDVLVQAVHLFGMRNTLGAFYYHGRAGLEAPPATAPMPGEEQSAVVGSKVQFSRYGAMANCVVLRRFDLVAGGALGKDRLDPLGTETKIGGFFAEVDAQLTKHWIGVYRFDSVNPDRDQSGATIRANVLATTLQADDHLYLTAEYRWLHRPEGNDNGAVVNARLIY